MNNTAANRITAAGNVTDTNCRHSAAKGLLPKPFVPGPVREHGLSACAPVAAGVDGQAKPPPDRGSHVRVAELLTRGPCERGRVLTGRPPGTLYGRSN